MTGRPYQTLGAAELIDVFNRQVGLLKSGETDVDSAFAAWGDVTAFNCAM